VTAGRAWVIDRYSSRITVLDGQGTLLNTLQMHASAISATSDQLWVTDDIHDRAVRLDPLSGAQLIAVDLPGPAGPTDVAVTGDSVWIAAARANTVFRLDPTSNTLTDARPGLQDARTLSALGNDVWLASPSEDRIARLDPSAGRLAVTVDVCDTPIDVAATPTGAWVVCALGRALWRVDRAGSVVTRIQLDGVPTAVAADGERALVTLRAD
jgi:streptogramin lyase